MLSEVLKTTTSPLCSRRAFLAQVERGEYFRGIVPEEQGAQTNATMMQFAKAVTREVKAEGVGKKNREEDEAPSSPTARCTFTLVLF